MGGISRCFVIEKMYAKELISDELKKDGINPTGVVMKAIDYVLNKYVHGRISTKKSDIYNMCKEVKARIDSS
jgi:hypothetical protein